MKPVWKHLTEPFSPSAWHTQLSWADPISLASKFILPFHEGSHPGFLLLTPGRRPCHRPDAGRDFDGPAASSLPDAAARPDLRGWGILATILIIAGVAGPDTLGESHGNYLPQRVLLFGLVALVPILDFRSKTWTGRAAVLALVWAIVTRSRRSSGNTP